MNILDRTATLDKTHDHDWYAKRVLEEFDRKAGREFSPTPEVIWNEEDGDWEIPPTAEDGDWVRLTGPNAERLSGKTVRVRVETVDGPDPTVVALGERAIELVEKWKRSRSRDGDSEFMAGRRAGWIDELAFLMGERWGVVRDALERNKI